MAKFAQENSKIETAFKTYYRLLCFYAERIVGKDAAEDIVSEIFTKIMENKELVENMHATFSYLRKCVYNESLQYKRQLLKLRGYMVYVNEIQDLQYLRTDDDPLSKIISTEMHNEIMQEIIALPQKCREVFILVRLEGYTPCEAAEKLKISENTVYTHLQRAMKKLKKKIIGKQTGSNL